MRSTLLDGAPHLAPVVEAFTAALPRLAEEIRQAVVADDRERVRRLAHRLKGSAGGFGFPDIVTVAAEIEAHATGEDPIELGGRADTLAILCAQAHGRPTAEVAR